MSRSNSIYCPECGSSDTEREWVDFRKRRVDEIRTCSDCPVQFTNQFFLEDVEVQRPEDWEAPDDAHPDE